jgi:hypothetical protein
VFEDVDGHDDIKRLIPKAIERLDLNAATGKTRVDILSADVAGRRGEDI